MNTKALFAVILALLLGVAGFAQRPGGPPPGGAQPGMPGQGGPGRGPGGAGGHGRQGPGQHNEWTRAFDMNNDGNIDAAEFQTAIDRTFAALDRNGNGVIDNDEGRIAPPPPGGNQPGGMRDGMQGKPPLNEDGTEQHLLPPFFFDKALRDGSTSTKEQFTASAKVVFNDLDKDHDGVLSKDEARPPRRNDGGGDRRGAGEPGAPPAPPNGQFIAAEIRFGDKLVKGQPFSADTVIEDTRRLYDGSTVTKSMKGAIYRDSEGRTRREQPLEMIGGVQINGSNGQPQMMVFIDDFGARTQTFLDVNNKIARTHPIGNMAPPPPDGPRGADDAKVESLGTKTIQGVTAEGTRMTFQIPAGHVGNDKPIDVITETWFSPELQVLVMSRDLDPIAGEHVFCLTNIKLAEPSPDLFTVPQGYRVETGGDRRKPQE
ncbi:MAG: hypothetical protein ACJ73D_06035 [Pyrinomonadaceae bacterium]